MSRPDPTTVSTEVEDHQILETAEARGLSLSIAVDPWIDHQVVEDVVDDLRRELHHILDVGPEEVARADLIADGGDERGHAARNILALRELDREERVKQRIEEMKAEHGLDEEDLDEYASDLEGSE